MTDEAINRALAKLALERGRTSEEGFRQAQVLRAAGREISAVRMETVAAIMARLEEEEDL